MIGLGQCALVCAVTAYRFDGLMEVGYATSISIPFPNSLADLPCTRRLTNPHDRHP